MNRSNKKRILLLLAICCIVALTLVGFRVRNPQPGPPLSSSELKLIADQFELAFNQSPTDITAWFTEDAGYHLTVRAKFAGINPEHTATATWFAPANRVDAAETNTSYAFSCPVPNYLASTAKDWTPYPVQANDSVYSQKGLDQATIALTSWALIRTQGDATTIYLVQEGDRTHMKALLRAALTKQPIEDGSLLPCPDPIYSRHGLSHTLK